MPPNAKRMEFTLTQLNIAKGSLIGISGLLTQGTTDVCFHEGELYGLGQLLKKISDDLQKIENDMREDLDI